MRWCVVKVEQALTPATIVRRLGLVIGGCEVEGCAPGVVAITMLIITRFTTHPVQR